MPSQLACGLLFTLLSLSAAAACGEPDCPSYLRTEAHDCVAPGAPADAGTERTGDRESPQSTMPDAAPGRAVGGAGGRAVAAMDGGSGDLEHDAGAKHDAAPTAGAGGSSAPNEPRNPAAGAGGMSMMTSPNAGAPATAMCGNGMREGTELCDGDCKTMLDCKSDNPCTPARLDGAAATCDAHCVTSEITACSSGDKCCPMGCNHGTDTDCSPSCGDGVLTGNEKCEPGSADHPCPTARDCDDGNVCTEDSVTGDAEQCSAACAHKPMMRAAMSCDDGDPCTDDMMVESATDCSFACMPSTPRTPTGSCTDFDPCTDDTPSISTTSCRVECPHARREPDPANCADDDPCTDDTPSLSGTSCAYECPHHRQQPAAASCDDGNQCTTDTQVLSKSRCAYDCEHKSSTSNKTGTPETSCNNRDDDCDGKTDEGTLNECNGCGSVHYEPQAVPPGKPCAYYWDNDNSGDCATTGVGKCVGTDTVICDAPKPACAP